MNCPIHNYREKDPTCNCCPSRGFCGEYNYTSNLDRK